MLLVSCRCLIIFSTNALPPWVQELDSQIIFLKESMRFMREIIRLAEETLEMIYWEYSKFEDYVRMIHL